MSRYTDRKRDAAREREKMARRHSKGGNHLEQTRIRQTTMEDIDFGGAGGNVLQWMGKA